MHCSIHTYWYDTHTLEKKFAVNQKVSQLYPLIHCHLALIGQRVECITWGMRLMVCRDGLKGLNAWPPHPSHQLHDVRFCFFVFFTSGCVLALRGLYRVWQQPCMRWKSHAHQTHSGWQHGWIWTKCINLEGGAVFLFLHFIFTPLKGCWDETRHNKVLLLRDTTCCPAVDPSGVVPLNPAASSIPTSL